jgi:hypothetical protein
MAGDPLRELSARLLHLHTVLLGRERRAYEAGHGPTQSFELLQLVLHDEQFAWLRSLSGLITRIDAALDEDEVEAALNVEGFFRQTHQLLRSGGTGPFESKYVDALQESPDVVMAHAAVVKVLAQSRPERP